MSTAAGAVMWLNLNDAPQDAKLTLKPEWLPWKSSYQQFYNFACVTIPEDLNTAEHGITLKKALSKQGDLVIRAALAFDYPAVEYAAEDKGNNTWGQTNVFTKYSTKDVLKNFAHLVDSFAYQVYEKVDLMINGVTVETVYGEIQHGEDHLALPPHRRPTTEIGHASSVASLVDRSRFAQRFVAELPFETFSRERAFPLQALGGSVLELSFKFVPLSKLYIEWGMARNHTTLSGSRTVQRSVGGTPSYVQAPQVSMKNPQVLLETVFLESDVRKSFIAQAHEFLIREWSLQSFYVNTDSTAGGVNPSTSTVTLNLQVNHPVDTMRFVFVADEDTKTAAQVGQSALFAPERNNKFNYAGVRQTIATDVAGGIEMCTGETRLVDPFGTLQMKVNTQFIIEETPASYFRTTVPRRIHSTIPDVFIYVIPFGQEPEDWRPFGYLNFTKTDDVKVMLKFIDLDGKPIKFQGTIKWYCRNYNWVSIKNKTGGKLYA
eukprot:TRINITY_DN326_c0_g1_i1.p1 TRINITY_DN326_c0_g1~~TRINITY_DN326_c0_g1_i1.p1  ORF type:complete len:490 (-),score=159.14 TRINITY_DN326_c0_g1_i1:190-1659(-)